MSNNHTRLSRRSMLKLGAASVAAAGSQKMFPQLAGNTANPASSLVLRSSSLELTLDAAYGIPSSYRLTRSGIAFYGADAGIPLKARICHLSPWTFTDVDLKPAPHKAQSGLADFTFTAKYENLPAADF